ncbi:MAG TPA: class II aldolase/adducin family protein [Ilumatobacteraceae bacterium]|nr:class II aldolase/adducin family protein [Ilumatobacteraceae bacterium]
MSADPLLAQREKIALACRILGARRLVDGILGHVSVRVDDASILIRCRGPHERGVARTTAADIRHVDLDGEPLEAMDGWEVPKELPIHTRLLAKRPEMAAVVHAHPPATLIAGLAGLELRAVFGAYNIPAMRLALEGVPVYDRPILVTRDELADEMLAAMGDRRVCILRGHGITVAGESVEQATVTAVDLDELCSITVRLAELGASPPVIAAAELAELPDLGRAFNDVLRFQALAAAAPLD